MRTALKILHCDNHVLAVDKPAGLLSQGDATGDPSLLELSREWVKRTYQKPGNVFLGLVHRLDRPVSGVMVFGRTIKGAGRLSQCFRERSAQKTYLSFVSGSPPYEGTLVDDLDGRECRLRYRTLVRVNGKAMLIVSPLTGRKHQIRRQLSMMGHPIWEDIRYGAPTPMTGRRIALHAYRLEVRHPTTKELLCIETERPEFIEPAFWRAVTEQAERNTLS